MAAAFKISVVAPDRTVVEAEAISLVAPGVEGYLGVQRGHTPMIVALRTGLLEYRDTHNQQNTIAIRGGFMEITGDSVIVIADGADLAEEVDLREAEQELEEARKALRGEVSSLSSEQATEAMERALTRIRLARSKN